DSLESPQSYTPVEISKEALLQSVAALSSAFPDIDMQPIAGDFDLVFSRPDYFSGVSSRKRVVFFPGSTIGNFDPVSAREFLKKLARTARKGGGLLIGVDLIKDRSVLLDAYNDSRGITAAFNKNLLQRINNELQGNFDLRAFNHRSLYNEDHDRIEMHLVSLTEQTVAIDGQAFHFDTNESIHTENSHKYSVDSFTGMAADAGFGLVDYWCDPKDWFAIFYFEVQQ
ncbi:MAG: L-histidine N(alpha)-methyltransferase, partial [Ketobacteraceae bacterium]|nr:L-histidine N(alpha)-methyltransferase [Ketobacteraceae bacterium]